MTPVSVAEVKAEAARIGFVACGIARLDPSRRGEALDRWLAAGHAGTMGYLPRQARKRKAPATITPGARTAVVVLENYAAGPDERPHQDDAFQIASYARGTDYHVVTHGRLHQLSEWLKGRGAAVAHTWVDDGPVPERELAERAGLGWIGKNTMLIHPRIGSFTLIGSVFTDLELAADPPLALDHCGSCTRCLDACPTDAFVTDRVLDARRCLSYLTIEYRADPPPELAARFDGWAFGCDICNTVCPWNVKFAEPTTVAEFRDRGDPDRRDAAVFERMDDAEFSSSLWRHTPGPSRSRPDAPQRPARRREPARPDPMTPNLHSVAIFVTDLERARGFYEESLGLPLLAAGSFGFQFLETPPHLSVHPAEHPSARAMVGRETGFTFRVDNLLDFCSRLGERGVRFVAEPTQQGFGIMALVADPDGNVLALWEDNVSPPPEDG